MQDNGPTTQEPVPSNNYGPCTMHKTYSMFTIGSSLFLF